MIRIQGAGERVDPVEERKKVRQTVLVNLGTFFLLCGLIRAVPVAGRMF
ncbi:hypothetical protein R5R35_014293 [Gryllus longicercus]|uniref:Uncharacterized protein n=1 Tax=Gryllus longicercus TaxID=2509291 RepID=A0AAN9W7E3_9ORTH